MPATTCKLDVKSFEGTNASEKPEAKSAYELEKIAKELHHLGSGFHKLSVKLVEEKEAPHNKGKPHGDSGAKGENRTGFPPARE